MSTGVFAAAPVRGAGLTLARAERWLFAATVVAAASMNWLAPRLPMVDLPQHAAQVALWRDLILGQSPWTEQVWINLATPYLIGYGLMLPFSFFVSMDVAARIVLTLAFLAFVAACMALRRAMQADRRADWLFPLSFFGFCWKLGFFTFLVASPVALVFILLAFRHARDPSRRRGAGLVLAGTILLFAHGLMFVAGVFLGGLLMLEQAWMANSRLIARFLPYVVLGAVCIAFRFATQQVEGAMLAQGYSFGAPIWERPLLSLFRIGDIDGSGTPVLAVATFCALASALLVTGPASRRAPLALLGGLALLLCVLPGDAFQTGMIYQRFVLFLPAFVGLAFVRADGKPVAAARAMAASCVLIVSVWTVLAIQGSRIAAFARESRPFETILNAAEPGKRALAAVFDQDSDAASNRFAYLHHPSWYQAEKHGFVDFNFAVFHPQVVRFRHGKTPRVDENVRFASGDPGWGAFDAALYEYFFARGSDADVAAWVAASPCVLKKIAQDAEWHLLQRVSCNAKG